MHGCSDLIVSTAPHPDKILIRKDSRREQPTETFIGATIVKRIRRDPVGPLRKDANLCNTEIT